MIPKSTPVGKAGGPQGMAMLRNLAELLPAPREPIMKVGGLGYVCSEYNDLTSKAEEEWLNGSVEYLYYVVCAQKPTDYRKAI